MVLVASQKRGGLRYPLAMVASIRLHRTAE